MKFRQYLLVLLTLGVVACGPPPPPPDPEVVRPVRVVLATSKAIAETKAFAGRLDSAQKAALSFRIGGTVTRVAVKVGDQLAAGALVAELDPKDLLLQVQNSASALQRARAEARNSKSAYERTRKLYMNRAASRSELDSTRSASEGSARSVEGLEKQLALSKSQGSYAKLTAPYSCIVAQVDIEAGENVNAGSPVVGLACGDGLEVQVRVSEAAISRVKSGMDVQIKVEAFRGEAFPGVVSEVGVTPETGGGNYPVTVRIPNPNPALRSGMSAVVVFHFGGDERRMVVPMMAVSKDSKGHYGFIAETTPGSDEALLRRRDLEVGDLLPGGVQILSGLAEGDQVVIAGVSKASEGLKVRLLPPEGS